MGLVAFTGGIRSGKSAAAAALAGRRASEIGGASAEAVAVVAFGKRGTDDEFDARIARHRADRAESWSTFEAAYDDTWRTELDRYAVVVFDCLGTWLALEIDRALADGVGDPVGSAERTVADQVEALSRTITNSVWVTNEVGLSLVPDTSVGRRYVDALGRLNRALFARADAAYFVVAGHAIDLSQPADRVDWPK